MAQTPRQRRANEKFAKNETAKQGKRQAATTSQKQNAKSPLSTGWVVLLAFIICGGLAFELLRIVPEIWSFFVAIFNRLTG
ncbi:hypothetical protein PHISCL_02125 [Aspergillus sclerotialis]|uniref:Stress-associated endoplasmic reticulum protein n=1 Tax=Aspergillus sclerotialis TaxID=2070753 RepID=A0A3A2ZT67_9EURO|nr:hypothetical protein PHISCL_02125 [Aspergillus sclerotialis]